MLARECANNYFGIYKSTEQKQERKRQKIDICIKRYPTDTGNEEEKDAKKMNSRSRELPRVQETAM